MKQHLDEAVARLDDYVRGHMPDADAHDFERDLFARALDGAAPELEFRAALERALLEMNARGTIGLFLTQREVDELPSKGIRVLRFVFDLANPTMPDLSGDFDVLVTRVPIALERVRHLEAEILAPDGRVLKVMPEIPFDASAGAVFLCCERELALKANAAKTISRVWAYDDSGRRLVAEVPSGI